MASRINEYAAQWWADRLDDQHADKREAFRQALLERLPEGDWETKCDYDPWDELLEAVRAVGIPCEGNCGSATGILPMKHSLYRRGNVLWPKEGYGQRMPNIYFTEAECSAYP